MKNKIYISRLEYLENGIDLTQYGKVTSIRVIDPKHDESIIISTEEYLKCKDKDLICLLINEE